MEMQSFVHRPVPRLQRYSLMMGYILETTPLGHVDQSEIPQLRDMINVLSKDFESGMKSSEMRVKLWGINKLLVFKAGETIVSIFFFCFEKALYVAEPLRYGSGFRFT
jgi:RHO1 GDP-GTP exchange protein 1/2